MSANSAISWTDATFNLAWGCIKVSPGCDNCYAMTLAKRRGFNVWGPAKTTERRTFTDNHWRDPIRWNAKAASGEPGVRGVGNHLVFCSSMADVFEDHPTIEAEREKLWPLIRATPHLDWQLLTKRPERIAANLPADWGTGYPNVWLGTSVENQKYADERIPVLLNVPARVRFLSCEPLIGPVSLRGSWHDYLQGWTTETQPECCRHPINDECCGSPDSAAVQAQTNRIDWVIVGGESGSNRRPMDLAWARQIMVDCASAGVAFFFKQIAAPRPGADGPSDLNIKEFPQVLS